MNDTAFADLFGTVGDDNTLTIRRLMPGPVERVWAYLTDSALRRQWLAAGEMELRVGARFEFVWRNDELGRDGRAARPEGAAEEHRLDSEILAVDPPRLLAFSWEKTGGVVIELEPVGQETLLTLTHRQIDDRALLRGVSAGWPTHLGILEDVVAGREPATFWTEWRANKKIYDERSPA